MMLSDLNTYISLIVQRGIILPQLKTYFTFFCAIGWVHTRLSVPLANNSSNRSTGMHTLNFGIKKFLVVKCHVILSLCLHL